MWPAAIAGLDAWATAHAKGITHANQVEWGLRRQ